MSSILLALALAFLLTATASAQIQDLVPDIVVRANELYDYQIVTNEIPGHTLLRLSNATANIGLGKLYLYGVLPANGDGTQDVWQRVWRTDGTHFDREAGTFVHHPEHGHIHFEDWAIYRLRNVTAGGGVGSLVVEGAKTSFCILDGLVHDPSLPGFPSNPEFTRCDSTFQGLSVGWADIYSKNLEGQALDITDVPAGQYWLESEADPLNHVLEKDETNNVARILVTLGNPGSINPDPYEPNDQISDLSSRQPGGPNSPVLGPCGPVKMVSGLTIHASGNDDLFQFYMPASGGTEDKVRIDFPPSLGDLDLAVLTSAGTAIGVVSGSGESFEEVSLLGDPSGWYYARVSGRAGATNPGYALTIRPSKNGTPSISVVNPPAGNTRVPETSTYTATWSSSDPEANQTWVDVYLNTSPVLDGREIFLPSSQATPGSQGFFVINPAGFPGGTYYVYTRITDGGTVSGDWSAGTITIVPVTGAKGRTPAAWQLLPAAPNPFNPHTVIEIQVPVNSRVSWRIHDARGTLVRTIVDGMLPAGRYSRTWDGRDDREHEVASGTYYMVVEGKGYRGRQKLTLLR